MPESNLNVAALVAQMPDTDLQKERPGNADAVRTGSKVTGPEPAEAEKVFAAILDGGAGSLTELLTMVKDPADQDFPGYKPGYVLHGICLLAARPEHAARRAVLAETIAARLKLPDHTPFIKETFIRELQAAGGPEVIPALAACLPDAKLCDTAAQALLAIGAGAAEPLRAAMEKADGAALVTIIHALGTLQDQASVAALRKHFARPETDIRRAAAVALANTGDEASAGGLLEFANASSGWERTHATSLCFRLAERLTAAGKKPEASRLLTGLRDSRKEPDEKFVQDAAAQALEALAP